MKTDITTASPIRVLSAWLPLTMSIGALILVIGHAAVFGITQDADEGTAAHVWQILMTAQVPIVAYFIFKWIPQQPRKSLHVLILLLCMWIANIAAVYLLT